MNIKKYMQAHESTVREQLLLAQEKKDWELLKNKHELLIKRMQHERLIHLLVTLAFGVFILITMASATIAPSKALYLLMGLFLVLFVPYVAHYFFLENAVQRWYQLSDEIDGKMKGGR